MELIRDFLEDFGGVVVMSFLVMTTASLATGVIPIVLMFLGISAVIFLIWFFYMYGRAVQVLMEIWFGKIQVKTKQQIFFRPQFFTISNATTNMIRYISSKKKTKNLGTWYIT